MTVEFEINARGAVLGASVSRSDLSDAFDACVVDAMRWWRYPGDDVLRSHAPGGNVEVVQTFIVVP